MNKLLVLVLSVTAASTQTGLAQNAAVQAKSGCPAELRFGLLPSDESTVNARYEPLFGYLSGVTGSRINHTIGADYAAIIVAMTAGKLDMALYGPESFVQAAKQSKVLPLVMVDNINTGTGYYSSLYVRADSPYKTLADLKGRTLAFVDPNSTSGYLMPMVYLLRDAKLRPDTHFSQVLFAGNHSSSLLSLVNKKVDVAAISSSTITNAIKAGQLKEGELRVLWTSKKIPNSPIAVSGRLSGSCRATLQKALLSLKDPKILSGFTAKRFVVATNNDYAPVREADRVKQQLLKK